MNSPCAISHLVHEPDWLMLRCQSPEVCAESIQSILKTLEANERWAYAIRGEALRLFDERELYRLFTDPAKNQPCSCTFRWLEVYLPDSCSYAQGTLKNRQKLYKDVPLEKAANISRANLRILEGASESVRRLPEVQDAAETLTQKQFASKLSMEYHQHLEAKRTLKFTFDAGDAEQVEKALDIIGELTGFTDRSAQLLAWAIDYLGEQDDSCGEVGDCTAERQALETAGQ